MKSLLLVKASVMSDASVSSQLADELVGELNTARVSSGAAPFRVTTRNFDENPVPHLDNGWLRALMTPEADRNHEQQAKVDYSDRLIAELQQADVIVLALPMYNFSVPSTVKAWNDHIARAGVTFKYTASGSIGLLGGKKVYLVVATGGIHEAGKTDFLQPYMTHFLGFLGLDDIDLITATGLNMGDEARAAGLAAARAAVAGVGPMQATETRENELEIEA
ncbi:MAG: NAD(P)H-dependent oxidoreductase [Pseudohongiellaceae bacterium]